MAGEKHKQQILVYVLFLGAKSPLELASVIN